MMLKNVTYFSNRMARCLLLTAIVFLSACSTNLQSKVSGNINHLSKQQTVAILPVQTLDENQQETAAMFRQSLYANLKQSHFNLLERYIVDGLLEQSNLNDPAKFGEINPMTLGEILGADAIVLSRINRVERSYMVVHSSIELSVSVEMVDTRSGEVLWRAEQTESDFQGIGKIPTGIAAALLAPIQFVTNKLNLQGLTSKMTSKLTALIKNPEEANAETTFDETIVVTSATRDLKEIEKMQKLKSEWKQSAQGETDFIAEDIKSIADTLEMYSPPGSADQSASGKNFSAQKNHGGETVTAQTPTVQHIKLAGKPVIVNAAIRNTNTSFNERHAVPPPVPAPKTGTQPEETKATNQIKTPETVKPIPEKPLLYTVQVGAYSNRERAEQMTDRLIKRGYKAFTNVSPNEKMLLYQVRVEKFSGKEQALELSEKIRKEEKLANFVAAINPG